MKSFQESIDDLKDRLEEHMYGRNIDKYLEENEENDENDEIPDCIEMPGVIDIPSTKVVKCSVSNCRFMNGDKCIREGIVSITESSRCLNYSPRDCPDPVKEFISPIESVEI